MFITDSVMVVACTERAGPFNRDIRTSTEIIQLSAVSERARRRAGDGGQIVQRNDV